MLTRYVLTFTMIAGAALAGPALDGPATSHGGLVKGQTTVAEVEQELGAPVDTVMRADGALTLMYAYARCSQLKPAMFPTLASADMSARTVSLRFGSDFRYRSKTVTSLTPSLASDDTGSKTIAAR